MARTNKATESSTGTDEPFTDDERIAAGMEPIGTGSADSTPTGNRAAFSRAELQALAEAADPLQMLADLAAAKGKDIKEASEALGDGTVIMPKDSLVNREFYVVDWRFCEGDMGTFSAVKCMDPFRPADNGRMFVFTDGGTGIHDRLVDYYMKHGETGIIHVPHGLSPSTYEWSNPETGESGTGTTFYFANGPVKVK